MGLKNIYFVLEGNRLSQFFPLWFFTIPILFAISVTVFVVKIITFLVVPSYRRNFYEFAEKNKKGYATISIQKILDKGKTQKAGKKDSDDPLSDQSSKEETKEISGEDDQEEKKGDLKSLSANHNLSLNIKKKSVKVRDGLTISYYTVGTGKSLFVVGTGLGFASGYLPMFVGPLTRIYGNRWTFLTWDYRGLFDSEPPTQHRRLAIPEHAEDIREIILHENFAKIDVFAGWSMGVQVGLELCCIYPELVGKLILLNGTHGQVFQSSLQPFVRFAYGHTVMNFLLNFLKEHPVLLSRLLRFIDQSTACRNIVWAYCTLFVAYSISDSPIIRMYGLHCIEDFTVNYIRLITHNPVHAYNYLCLFQELDAHSVYHLLTEINQETLIVSGLMDILTPAYLGFEMQRRIPHNRHLVVPFATHFCLLDANANVIKEMVNFLDQKTLKKRPKHPRRPSQLETYQILEQQRKLHSN